MTRILVDENLSQYLAVGLDSLQRPLNSHINLVSIIDIFGKGAKDEDWIPKWGKADGIVLTQDVNITRTRHLAEMLKQYELGAFFLKVSKRPSYWDNVKVLVRHWLDIAKIIHEMRKPYTYFITSNKVQKMK